jgi:hypothetical protein
MRKPLFVLILEGSWLLYRQQMVQSVKRQESLWGSGVWHLPQVAGTFRNCCAAQALRSSEKLLGFRTSRVSQMYQARKSHSSKDCRIREGRKEEREGERHR